MARFNQTSKNTNVTTNYEGAKAYKVTPQVELYTLVCASTLSGKFYESADERLTRLRSLIPKVDPEFVCKLAIYAREYMFLRSIPLVLLVEVAKSGYTGPVLRKAVARTIQRVDELTEILGYYQIANERTGAKKLGKLSKAIQKGVADAFDKFDEYQFAKYNRPGEIKLRDVLFLSHSKPKSKEREDLYKKIVENTLEVPYTWETQLSTAGQTGRSKKEVWEELIDSRKLGYMAVLRNLRNILQANVSNDHIDKVCAFLKNPDMVAKSKQLPFRYLAAYRELLPGPGHYNNRTDNEEISHPMTTSVLTALEEAVIESAKNLPGFGVDTTVLVASDVSGSMFSPISMKSSIKNYDIGLILSMTLHHNSKAVISGIFGDNWKAINLPKTGILANVNKLYEREGEVGYSTNGYLVIQDILSRQQVIDKVMIFTDCQLWDSSFRNMTISKLWASYRSKVNKNAKLYLFDLSGYGKVPIDVIGDHNTYLISGWSNEVFRVLEAIEDGASNLTRIEDIKI